MTDPVKAKGEAVVGKGRDRKVDRAMQKLAGHPLFTGRESEVKELNREKEIKTMNKQKYIIRCDQAGVFYGEIKERRGDEADLENVRRVHGWDGACSLSQLATEGPQKTDGNNRWSVIVPSMTVLGVIEFIPVSADAEKVMDGMPVWKR